MNPCSGYRRTHPSRISVSVLFTIAALLVTGCHSWPDESSNDESATAQGSYVGSGRLGGSPTNILVIVSGPDSASRYSGSIRYRSLITDFEDVFHVINSDSLWFRYHRDNVFYRAWAAITGSGLSLHFVEPSGIPAFRVNREISGYNMSGQWNGRMSSIRWQLQNDAVMTIEQEGQSFGGTVETAFFQTTRFEVNNGVINEGAFHLNAMMFIGSSNTSAILYGIYSARDTTAGFWEAGENGTTDNGQFIFYRSFD